MKRNNYLVVVAFIMGLAVASVVFKSYRDEPLYKKTRLFKGSVEPGCILVASMDQSDDSRRNPKLMPRVFLINKKKKIVHSWNIDTPPFSAKLDKEGNLWVLKGFSVDARKASLVSYNDSSASLITVSQDDANHDFDFLPDGNMLLIVRSLYTGILPEKFARIGPQWQNDSIQIVDPDQNKILRTYDLSELLDFSAPVEGMPQTSSVLQVNSVRYIERNPINQRPAILLSVRLTSTVAFIDYETGQVIWKSPKGAFDTQHDPSLLNNGDLLVFNNGTKSFYSSVIQFSPKENKEVWKYRSFDREDFFNHYHGGAQRLPNGNTLITAAAKGYVFEVDPEGRKVWEWFNSTMVPRTTDSWPYASMFRAIQYLPDAPEIRAWSKHCGGN